jgi:phosphatidylserine decarboxylase
VLRPYEPLLSIVPEGWGVIGALGGTAVLMLAGGAVLAPAMIAAALMPAAARFWADPRSGIACKPRGVLAPLDGTVIHRRECHDPILGREAIRIVVRTRFWGPYCLRAPIAGDVMPLPPGVHAPGVSRIRAEDGQDLLIRVTRGSLLGSRPVMVGVGERVGQGRRCGLRRLAREIELIVPAGWRVDAQLGQRVRSGQTLLATMLRKS